MTNVLEKVPGDQWDLEFQLEMIQQALDTEDYDQALNLTQEGLKKAEEDPLYLKKFEEALREIKVNLPQKKAESNKEKKDSRTEFRLTEIKGIGDSTAEKLRQKGIDTPEHLIEVTPEKLAEIKGISHNSATKFIASAHALIKQCDNDAQEKPLENQNKKSQKISTPQTSRMGLGLDKHIGIMDTTKTQSVPEKTKSTALNNNDEEVHITEEKNMLDVEEEIDFQSHTKPTSVKKYGELVIPKEVNNLNTTQNKDSSAVSISQSDEKSSDQILHQKSQTKTEPHIEDKDDMLSEQVQKRAREDKEKKIKLPSPRKETLVKKIKSMLSDEFHILKDTPISDCDCIAIKSVKVSEYEFSLLIVPIRAEHFNKRIILSEDHISVSGKGGSNLGSGRLVHEIGLLSEIKADIFHNIITKDTLYSFLRHYLREDFETEYIIKEKQLNFHCGKMSFSVYISPVFVCNASIGFREKSIPFPYQRHSELHVINVKSLSYLMDFLVRKFASLTIHHQKNHNIVTKARAYNTYLTHIRLYSVPMLVFGIILGLFMIPFYELINILFGLSLTASVIYIFIMLWIHYQYKGDLKRIDKKEGKELTETDLEVIGDAFTPEEMEQFIYEYFGKNSRFTVNTKRFLTEKAATPYYEDFHTKGEIEQEESITQEINSSQPDSSQITKEEDTKEKIPTDLEDEDLVKKYLKIADED